MLGATEFTMIGNVVIGMMAIGGVFGMLFSVGSYMTASPQVEEKHAGAEEPAPEVLKKAA